MSLAHLLELAIADLDIKTEKHAPLDIVAQVKEELEQEFQPTRRQVFVRTDPMVRATPGGIILTANEASFYKGPAHAKIIKSTVVAAGPQSEVKPGDRVCFQRLHFARITTLKDGTNFGAVDENELVGYIIEE